MQVLFLSYSMKAGFSSEFSLKAKFQQDKAVFLPYYFII
ncbi:hypothetical protein HMPREF1153_0549 [Selenomonas sp. CM52]|nr:hypothetical protein HMPREF1153_0549 [Selenomonas sp. CM52]